MKKALSSLAIAILILTIATSASAQYIVKKGDTLSRIAKKHNMFLSRIKELNPLIKNYDLILPNQKINVTDNVSKATQITDYAIALQTQTKYVYGANDFSKKPYKADCSSWTQHIYRTFGIVLPRTSREQAKVGKAVTFQQLQKADLVFFSTRSDKVITHVGIYLGNGKWISNLGTGKDVKLLTVNATYFKDYFLYGKRVH